MNKHVDGDNKIIPYTAGERATMNVRTFRVRDGSHPTETRTQGEVTMTRTFLCAWAERFNFVNCVLGDSQLWLDTSVEPNVYKLVRVLPDEEWGRHPTDTQIMATGAPTIRGLGAGTDDADGMPEYVDAEVEVEYEFFPFQVGSQNSPPAQQELDRFVWLGDSTRSEAEVFGPMPGGALKATSEAGAGFHGRPAPYGFSISRPIERFTIHWHYLPWELVSSGGALFERLYFGDETEEPFVPYIGTVNAEEIDFASFGRRYRAGTLLLESVELTKVRSHLAEDGTAGLRAKVGFNYAFAPRGWLDLFMYDPGTPANSGYYRMSADGTFYAVADMPDNTGLFNTRDHNNLFKADI